MKKGIDYPGVTVIFLCHDGEGNYLFQKRSQKCRDEKGNWDCGGGSLDFGLTIEETLKKEIMEEYCTDVLDYEFLGYNDVHRENDGVETHWVALQFRVLIDKDKVRLGEPDKCDEIGWFRIDELPAPLHSQLPGEIEKYKGRL